MNAVLPGNEEERLRALYRTGLLDTPAEDEFDSLVRLAAVICGTPIASVTLIDKARQWHKAMTGIQDRETPRDIAFCAHTILQDDLFVIPDTLQDLRFSENPLVTGDPFIRFYAGLPLESDEGHHLGTLCVIDRSPRDLSEAQRQALQLLAVQANKLINLRRQQHELESAAAHSDLVERELRSSQELFHSFMDHAPFLAFMKDAKGRIVYYNRGYAEHFKVARGAWLNKSDEELWPIGVATALRANDRTVLRQWKTIVVEEQAHLRGTNEGHWRSYRFPFRDSQGQEYVAAFSVDITADKKSAQQIEKYQRALEAANEKLLSLSVTDGLTKLLNRRAFDAALDAEFSASLSRQHALSFLMVDIDDFKSFNDTYGHSVGDQVLQSVAAAIEKGFRAGDIVARYGGEEFAVLLPNTTRQAAIESAERLRTTVRDLNSGPHRITISIGVSSTSLSASATKADLVRRADDALYRAKREGKDRICLG